MPVSYLIRFDDICPTMNWKIWAQIEAELNQCAIKPILAVVPDNQDAKLVVDESRKDFWECVRRWQRMDWTIGLHGYQHRYVTQQRGIVGLNARSEFAGLPASEQKDKLRRGLAIFEREGVHADAWIAPAHSFDLTTVQVLHSLSVQVISDGFHVFPYTDADGMIWVPQQIWRFAAKPFGVWTVCYHSNSWSGPDLGQFRADLGRYARQIRSMQGVVEQYKTRQKSTLDMLAWRLVFGGIQMRTALGRVKLKLMTSPKTKHATTSAR